MEEIKKHLIYGMKSLPPQQIAEYAVMGYLHFREKENSYEKGRQAEINWMNELACFRPKDVSKTSHSGDFLIEKDEKTIMIEIKNYKRDVPTKEVAKFENDSKKFDGALMISATKIVGRENFCLEGNLIFLKTEDSSCAKIAIEFLLSKISSQRNSIDQKKFQEIERIYRRIFEIQRLICEIRRENDKKLNKLYLMCSEMEMESKVIISDSQKKSHFSEIFEKAVELFSEFCEQRDFSENICYFSYQNLTICAKLLKTKVKIILSDKNKTSWDLKKSNASDLFEIVDYIKSGIL